MRLLVHASPCPSAFAAIAPAAGPAVADHAGPLPQVAPRPLVVALLSQGLALAAPLLPRLIVTLLRRTEPSRK